MTPNLAAVHDEYQQLLDDLFHALSQPLTSLSCCLAVSVQQPRTAGRYRRDLRMALLQAESVRQIITSIRTLLDASLPAEPQPADLRACVMEVVDDLRPVAESRHVQLRLIHASACRVNLEAGRLRQALFHLIDFTLHACRPAALVEIKIGDESGAAELCVQFPSLTPRLRTGNKSRELMSRLAWAIARNILEAAQGRVEVRQDARQICLAVRLPRAGREPATLLARPSRRCG